MIPSLSSYLSKIQRTLEKNIFFVAGTEKSGTTWLQMMINQHPQAVCKGEGQFGTRLWPSLRQALNEYSSFIGELNQKVFSEVDQFPVFNERSIRSVQVFTASLLLSEYGDGDEIKAVGEKTPGHIRTLDRLKALFPESKYIFIFRDGRDIAISGWYHLKRQHGEDKGEALSNYAKRIARVWRNDYEKVLEFAKSHEQDCAFVRYEDLHQNPTPELARLFEFLGLDAEPATIERCIEACRFSKLAGGRERGEENTKSHFRKGIVGDWHNHFDHAAWETFDTEAGELLARMGYQREWTPPPAAEPASASSPEEAVATKQNEPAEPQEVPQQPEKIDNATLLARANQYAENGDWQNVIETIERVHANGLTSFNSWYQLGRALRAVHEPARAAEAFRQSLTSFPKHKEAQFMLAVTLKEAGQHEAAIEAYQHLLRDHPDYVTGWKQYGIFLKEIKHMNEAIVALRRALELREDIPTHNVLVMTLADAGLQEQAIEEGGKLLALKDKSGLNAFKNSAFSKVHLTPANKTFNYGTPHRNVISFSLWGDNPTYVHGAIVNAQIAPNLYYGWRTRFYCDNTVPADAIDELKRLGAEIIMVDDPALQAIRPLWRFFASDDPNVDWFICRDTDSRLNAQELLAVEEWVHSGKPFHIMRDHIYHMELILAGMWGGMAGVLPNLREMILSHPRYFDNRFSDQKFLMELVWPLIKEQTLIHDSYYHFAGSKEFPAGYRLPRPIHVGGAIKNMRSWRKDA